MKTIYLFLTTATSLSGSENPKALWDWLGLQSRAVHCPFDGYSCKIDG